MFTLSDVKRLANAADLPVSDDRNKTLHYGSMSKRSRNITLKSGESPDREITAAIEIQRVYRGYRTRMLLLLILRPSSACSHSNITNTISTSVSDIISSMNSSSLSVKINSSSSERSLLEVCYQSYTESVLSSRESTKSSDPNPHSELEKLLTFQGFCASTIQKCWRKKHCQMPSRPGTEKEEAVVVEEEESEESKAAGVIQKAWRRYIGKQVFQYYKRLLGFKKRGDASHMLKCINPKEAQLLEGETGLHVRFRLGGRKFPPCIYYKIFAHVNIADICSFAPRDYTKATNKQMPGKFLHNRGVELRADDNKEDWYQRIENNSWRPVHEGMVDTFNEGMSPMLQKKCNFHPQKLVRGQDVLKRRKERKIQWMKKIYANALPKPMSSDDELFDVLARSTTQGVLNTVKRTGNEHVDEFEVDELLKWTNGLNFDNYVSDWQNSATTYFQANTQEGLERASISPV